MQKTLLLSFFVCFSIQVFSQTMPSVKVGEDYLKITSLDIESSIVGNIATTTYNMTFFNHEDKVSGSAYFFVGVFLVSARDCL